MFNKFQDLIELSLNTKKTLYEVIIEWEMLDTGNSSQKIKETSIKYIKQMIESYKSKLKDNNISLTGWTGFNTDIYLKYINEGKSLLSPLLRKGILASLATSENNASMGKIVACPTAGASGVIPGVMVSLHEEKNISIEKLAEGLIISSAIGEFIRRKASLSGAVGGCQAEIGSAVSMGAAAITYIIDGDGEKTSHAAALALKFIMGLICDPVGGFVEIPCVKRNPAGTVLAFTSAELAISGIKSMIPFDEVVRAMAKVGRQMNEDLKETGRGGVAGTKTAKKLIEELYINKKNK